MDIVEITLMAIMALGLLALCIFGVFLFVSIFSVM